MKQLIFITLFSVIMITVSGQNKQSYSSPDSLTITRSTIGINGISKTLKTEKGTYIFSHSVGQSSVIGTFQEEGYTIRQGFQQPLLKAIVIQPADENSFSAEVFPNPFTDLLSLSFDITVKHNLYVWVYDVSGKTVFSNQYPAQQSLSLKLISLPTGQYLIKVITNKKQFISSIIKH